MLRRAVAQRKEVRRCTVSAGHLSLNSVRQSLHIERSDFAVLGVVGASEMASEGCHYYPVGRPGRGRDFGHRHIHHLPAAMPLPKTGSAATRRRPVCLRHGRWRAPNEAWSPLSSACLCPDGLPRPSPGRPMSPFVRATGGDTAGTAASSALTAAATTATNCSTSVGAVAAGRLWGSLRSWYFGGMRRHSVRLCVEEQYRSNNVENFPPPLAMLMFWSPRCRICDYLKGETRTGGQTGSASVGSTAAGLLLGWGLSLD